MPTPDLTHRELALGGIPTHVAECGDGPPLLLVHGLLVSHREWLRTLATLAPAFRCVLVDLPGFGESARPSPEAFAYTREAYARHLLALLDALELPRAHVAGHSMGGAIALSLAADHPDRVDRLGLVDAAAFPFPLSLKGRLPFLPVVGEPIFKHLYTRAVFRDYFRRDVWSGHAGMDLGEVDAYYDAFDRPGGRAAAFAALRRAIGGLETLVPKIRTIEAETLVLWGDDDRLFPVGLAHRLASELRRARLEILPHSGHAPNEEHPEATATLLRAHFLGQTR